jgi:hypothetical protein
MSLKSKIKMDSTVMQTLIQSLDREYVLQTVMQEKKEAGGEQ